MVEERVQRRLAAILAADIAGYSRLMGTDEAGTRVRFNALMDNVIRPAIDRHRGRLVKTMGDGLLAEFASVVDAVQCAADVQEGATARESGEVEERRLQLRVAVHLGDVIVEGDDIHGDGVNVAARLQALGEPGGVYLSDLVHASIRGKLALDFDDLGEQSLKNIAEPVRVYRVVLGTSLSSGTTSTTDALFRRPAVAVLPFENLSGDPEQEYFADGLTEDIITALSLWRSFPVIARNSTFAYKGKSPDIRTVGQELGARYVVEGSVRKAGNRIRVHAQLINAETGHHAWAERYDRDLKDIFELQDELTGRIAATVAPELERAERRRASSKQTSDLQAWDCYLRGIACIHETTKDSNWRAREMFERAVALDPTYSRGHAGIAYSHHRDALLGFSDDPERSIALCVEAAQHAVALDDTDAFAHYALSRGLDYAGRTEQGLHEAKLAVEFNPNDSSGHASLGMLLIMAGQADEGIAALRRARQLSPKDPRTYLRLRIESYGHFVVGRYDDAAALLKDSLNRRPGDPALRIQLAASLANAGRVNEARSALTDGEPIDPALLDQASWFTHRFEGALRKRLVDGLRKAGWQG